MASAEPNDRLNIRFDSPEQLRSEFEKNIANGGIFVPTEADHSVRQPIVVEIELDYVDAAGGSISLEGEIVHRIPPEMAQSGAVPGVAVQFAATAKVLRERFEPLLGAEIRVAPPDIDEVEDGTDQVVRAKRRAVRVPIRVMPESSPPFESTSRDLSATGVLISVGEIVLPKGEIVRTCLWHPNGESSIEIDGVVVREVRNKEGRIAAVAIAFDRTQAAEPRVAELITELSQAGLRNKLGGISGSIADLGLANLLQMFGSSAPQGTVVCEADQEQGWVAFADGDLLAAALGPLSGQEALIAMLDWPEGRFEFVANVDEHLATSTACDRRPLAGAILDAVCTIDEREAASNTDTEISATGEDWGDMTFSAVTADPNAPSPFEPRVIEFTDETSFSVNPNLEESMRSSLGKLQEAVLDLAKSGFRCRKIIEIVPEEPSDVFAALEELVEAGVLRVR